MRVRLYRPSDLGRCQAISGSDFDYNAYLTLPDHTFVVVEEDRQNLAGFAACHIWRWNRSAWLLELFVDPKYRNRGYGEALIEFLAEQLKGEQIRMLFERLHPSHPSLNFYLQSRFRIVGYNSRFFDEPTLDDQMALELGLDLTRPAGS
ncbi:MAG: GNAT family N-acetyltransferase [Bacillota bacterium]